MTGPDRPPGAHSAAEDAEREAPGLSALEEQALGDMSRGSGRLRPGDGTGSGQDRVMRALREQCHLGAGPPEPYALAP